MNSVRVVHAQAIAWVVAVAVAAGGAGTARARPAPDSAAPIDLSAAARVAETFIETAVRRVHTSQSFDLVTSSLRQGETRPQWARGDIAVIPIPEARFEQARLVVYRPARRPVHIAWLAVVSGRQDGSTSYWSFRIDLLKQQNRWRVDYWEPAPEAAWLARAVKLPGSSERHEAHRRRARRDPCCLAALLAVV